MPEECLYLSFSKGTDETRWAAFKVERWNANTYVAL